MRKPRNQKPAQPGDDATELARLFQDPDLLAMAALLPRYRRASLWLVLRESVLQLRQGRPCDLCTRPGKHLRFIGVGPWSREGTAPVGVMILCREHIRLSRRSLHKKFRGEMESRKPEEFTRFHDKPCILGPRIGGLTDLPSRLALQTCRDCKSPIWIRMNDEETIENGEQEITYLCFDCARPLFEAGRLFAVPM